jgi:Tol biopolymer transport system component
VTEPPRRPGAEPADRPPGERLDSWKEIAAYLNRDVTTVQRWERRERMPVHRHIHDKLGSVYAFSGELDAWMQRRGAARLDQPAPPAAEDPSGIVPDGEPAAAADDRRGRRSPLVVFSALAAILVLVIAVVLVQRARRDTAAGDLFAGAQFQPLSDFPGTEQAAALSRDGKFAAFVSDRDGSTDVWVTQIGTGRFYNLTQNQHTQELINASVRTLGFTPDAALVSFWTRRLDSARQSVIGIWGAPVLGGPARPYLEGVAEFDWSADGSRLVYHTPADGDPMFVREPGQQPRQIFAAARGQHAHFPVWSPDDRFIYFVSGTLLPDRLDIWRISPSGGAPERITHHEARVTHPVFIDARTLLYLARDADGMGPWIYAVDVERRRPRRVGFGLERYASLAGSADGSRLVATVTMPQSALWRVPLGGAPPEPPGGHRLALSTGSGSSPRMGGDYLLYVSSKGSGDAVWKVRGDSASELWSAAGARVIGAPAIARDGSRVAFAIRQDGGASLYVVNSDGTGGRVLTRTLKLQGTPAWAPDGQSMTVAADVDGTPQLFTVPLDGRAPSVFVREHASEPLWTPDGRLLLYSGPDVGTTFALKAVTADGRPHPLPGLTLTRGERRLAFLPGGAELVLLRGEIGHKDLWAIELASGAARQLTHFSRDFNVRDFDVAVDGREAIVEEVHDTSDVVLIQRPPR